jgi:hypothetical protein
VKGLFRVEGHLVSWGWDGAIRYWSLNGEREPGGHERAHKVLGVDGVLRLGDRLVSWGWGWDRLVRFWTLDGAPLACWIRPRSRPVKLDVIGQQLFLLEPGGPRSFQISP